MAAKIQISEQGTLQIGISFCTKPKVSSKPPHLYRITTYNMVGKKFKTSGYRLKEHSTGNMFKWSVVKYGFYHGVNWYYMDEPFDFWYALIPGHALRMDEKSIIEALQFIEKHSWEEWVKKHDYLNHSKERTAALLEAYAKEESL